MSRKNRIDTDVPSKICLEFVNTVSQTLTFTKKPADVFNPNTIFNVVNSLEKGNTIIKTISVGKGIVIDGNNMLVTFLGSDYENRKEAKLYAIGDPVNQGYRDIIIDMIVKHNY